MRTVPRAFAVLLLWLLCPACVWFSSRERMLISSDPLGARIFVDGEDTGFTTPKSLPLGGLFGHDHQIELKKKGYRTTTRRIYQYTEGYTSKWIDGAYDVVMFPVPIFWTAGDGLTPFGVRSAILPAELCVVLEKEDAPLLGFDLIAAQKQKAAEEAAQRAGAK